MQIYAHNELTLVTTLAAALNTELRDVLEPLLKEIESLNERVKEYDERMEKIAKDVYPEVALLKQVNGVGTQIALTYVLTIEDPYRFPKSRQVGRCSGSIIPLSLVELASMSMVISRAGLSGWLQRQVGNSLSPSDIFVCAGRRFLRKSLRSYCTTLRKTIMKQAI